MNKNIQKELKRLGNKEYAACLRKYFKTGKRDFELEERFLGKYYKSMSRTMLRYAIEKFPEEKRKSYLKGEL
jgi:hypothetical protein